MLIILICLLCSLAFGFLFDYFYNKYCHKRADFNAIITQFIDISTEFQRFEYLYKDTESLTATGIYKLYNDEYTELQRDMQKFWLFLKNEDDLRYAESTFGYLQKSFIRLKSNLERLKNTEKNLIAKYGLEYTKQLITDAPQIGISSDIVEMLYGAPNIRKDCDGNLQWVYRGHDSNRIFTIKDGIVVYISNPYNFEFYY
jgi:hypothetical protein